MDFISFFSPSMFSPTVFFIFITLVITFLVLQKKKLPPKQHLPLGSKGWPFVGETFEFLSDPEEFIRQRMKKYSTKIFKTQLFGEPMVVVCGTAGHKFVAANEGVYLRSWRPHSMQKLFRSVSDPISREAELHVVRAPGFLRREALIRYVENMDSIVQEHLKMHWEGKPTMTVVDQMELITIVISSRFFLGLHDPKLILKLAHLFHDIGIGLHSVPINFPGTVFHRAKKSMNALKREILLLIKEKRAANLNGIKMNDILAHLTLHEAQNGELMSDEEICGKITGLLMASFSSPVSALTSIFKFIGEKPAVFDKIREEQLESIRSKSSGQRLNWHDLEKMKYTWSVCLEVMRFLPPLQGTFREAIDDFGYEGFIIPKGCKINWTVTSTNKNSEYFPNPKELIPTRFDQETSHPPYTNVPFGGGPRICPGKEYARLVLLVILHNVVLNYKWELIYPDEKIVPGMVPLPDKGLPIRLMLL